MSDRPPLSVETTLRAIDPRHDKPYILRLISRVLDDCDPSERPAIQVTRWPTIEAPADD